MYWLHSQVLMKSASAPCQLSRMRKPATRSFQISFTAWRSSASIRDRRKLFSSSAGVNGRPRSFRVSKMAYASASDDAVTSMTYTFSINQSTNDANGKGSSPS